MTNVAGPCKLMLYYFKFRSSDLAARLVTLKIRQNITQLGLDFQTHGLVGGAQPELNLVCGLALSGLIHHSAATNFITLVDSLTNKAHNKILPEYIKHLGAVRLRGDELTSGLVGNIFPARLNSLLEQTESFDDSPLNQYFVLSVAKNVTVKIVM